MGLYEQVILTDIEFSDSQNADQALWKNVFYQVIERFRQLLKDPTYDNTPHIRNMLLTLLDEVRNVWEVWTGQGSTKNEVFASGVDWRCVSSIEDVRFVCVHTLKMTDMGKKSIIFTVTSLLCCGHCVLQGALFFDALLQKLQTVYQFKLEDYMDGMAIRARPLRKTVQ